VKIIILGSTGYLGEQFRKLYPDAVCPKVDIADRNSISALLDAEKPDIVINAAGKTGRPNIDWCEDHKEETFHANLIGPLILNEECAKRGIYWVQLSSGCIYTGDKAGAGFTEEDEPNFFGSFYSRTKIWSEQMLKEFPNVLILRLRMPFDDTINDRSLIMKLKKYARLNDHANSITYLPDFLKAAAILIDRRKTGIYNVVNAGAISAYDIIESYKKIIDPTHTAERLKDEDAPSATKVPRSNCILSIDKLAREGIVMRPVQEAVEEAWRRVKDAMNA
jgi:3,5-epimerase/4-reductase